jgi:hypothetical protein
MYPLKLGNNVRCPHLRTTQMSFGRLGGREDAPDANLDQLVADLMNHEIVHITISCQYCLK